MARVREAVGPDIQLCFDVHTRLDPTHVIQMCRDLEEFKPYFIEDPIRSENPSSYRNLRHQINLPIAAGEQWVSKWPFRQVIEEELIDYARIDLCIAGGLDRISQNHPLGRNPLHRPRTAQSAWPRLDRSLRRTMHGINERRRPRDAERTRNLPQ